LLTFSLSTKNIPVRVASALNHQPRLSRRSTQLSPRTFKYIATPRQRSRQVAKMCRGHTWQAGIWGGQQCRALVRGRAVVKSPEAEKPIRFILRILLTCESNSKCDQSPTISPFPRKNSPNLHLSQEQPLVNLGWTRPFQSTRWRGQQWIRV